MTADRKPVEKLLKDAGFTTLEFPAEHVIHASVGQTSEGRKVKGQPAPSPAVNAFDKAHAAFLQAAGKDAAFVDARKFSAVPHPVLIVHWKSVEPVESQKVEGQTSEEPAD